MESSFPFPAYRRILPLGGQFPTPPCPRSSQRLVLPGFCRSAQSQGIYWVWWEGCSQQPPSYSMCAPVLPSIPCPSPVSLNPSRCLLCRWLTQVCFAVSDSTVRPAGCHPRSSPVAAQLTVSPSPFVGGLKVRQGFSFSGIKPLHTLVKRV